MKYSPLSLCIAALMGIVVSAQATPSALTPAKDWGVLAFPAIEDFGFITLWFKWGKSYNAALDELHDIHATRLVITKSWSEIEPKEVSYKLDSLQDVITKVRDRNMDIFYGLQVINTIKREVPADLKDAAWDSPQMIARSIAILDKTLPMLDASRKNYVSFGNEVDIFLRNTLMKLPPSKHCFAMFETMCITITRPLLLALPPHLMGSAEPTNPPLQRSTKTPTY